MNFEEEENFKDSDSLGLPELQESIPKDTSGATTNDDNTNK